MTKIKALWSPFMLWEWKRKYGNEGRTRRV